MEALMTNSRVQRMLPIRLILLILMSLVILYLGVGFVRQAKVSYERREELHWIEQEVVDRQQENAVLEDQLTYMQSSEAAEKWGRENGWAKEDEVSVVVVAPAAELSSGGQRGLDQTREPSSTREAWWRLFFGEQQ
jgi:cell division protein FtsL